MNRYPAVITEYNPDTRLCRVEILGLTEGAPLKPLAEIEYPIGEKSNNSKYTTEILLQIGDTVWVAFIGGDLRFPIITGYRNTKANNSNDWRRFHQQNIELIAQQVINFISANNIQITTSNLNINTSNTSAKSDELDITTQTAGLNANKLDINAQITNIISNNITLTAPNVTISGNVAVAGNLAVAGMIMQAGTNIGVAHKHITTTKGAPTSGVI